MEFNATFLVSAISFILFVFIMNAILYKPVIKIMEEREAFLKSNSEKLQRKNSLNLLQQGQMRLLPLQTVLKNSKLKIKPQLKNLKRLKNAGLRTKRLF